MTINQRLLFLLDKQPTSQTDLAKAIGVSQSVISLYIKGDKGPSMETASKISTHFQVDLNWLWSGSGKAPDGWESYLLQQVSKEDLRKEIKDLTHELEKRDLIIEGLKEVIAIQKETIADLRKNRNP